MEMPNKTVIVPKRTYGTMFFVELSVKVITTPVFLARCVFRASSKFLDMARLIGMMELRRGMKRPMRSA